ncbi:MAG TPA: LCP family protein [Anaerolineaceae bacterium]|nr:LCP family protein [Anaerolineaceae bacterium]
MKTTGTLPIYRRGKALLAAGVLVALVLMINACGSGGGRPPRGSNYQMLSPWASATPTATVKPSATATPDVWPTFAPPSSPAATAIPPAAPRLELDEDVKIWLLLGTEAEKPFSGRTDAIHLLLINERLSKASVISIPGSLFVYLPGHTMQRLNTAFALGGMELVRDTLAYNFGIRPDKFVLVHPTEFKWLVDDLGSLDVSVLFPIRDACGGVPAGTHRMNGDKVYCYVSYDDGDEVNRTRRQQQVLQLLFTKLVQNGRLARLPVLYASYQDHLETDISLVDLLLRVPLALRLGDPDRVSYFVLGWEQLRQWELPDNTQTVVLLPREEEVAEVFDQALTAISEPSPLGEIVLTYEAQVTIAVALTQTSQATAYVPVWPTSTPIGQPTASATQPGQPTATRTPTRPGQPTATRTPTQPGQPTATRAPTATYSEPYPIPTAVFYTPTPPAYP